MLRYLHPFYQVVEWILCPRYVSPWSSPSISLASHQMRASLNNGKRDMFFTCWNQFKMNAYFDLQWMIWVWRSTPWRQGYHLQQGKDLMASALQIIIIKLRIIVLGCRVTLWLHIIAIAEMMIIVKGLLLLRVI